jgi:hypothetical protein
MADDKRRFPRIQSLSFVADRGRVFRTLDLSREGMMVEMDIPPAIGTRVHLDLALGESVLEVQGVVRRVIGQQNGRSGVGVQFDRLPPKSERAIRDYLLKRGK